AQKRGIVPEKEIQRAKPKTVKTEQPQVKHTPRQTKAAESQAIPAPRKEEESQSLTTRPKVEESPKALRCLQPQLDQKDQYESRQHTTARQRKALQQENGETTRQVP